NLIILWNHPSKFCEIPPEPRDTIYHNPLWRQSHVVEFTELLKVVRIMKKEFPVLLQAERETRQEVFEFAFRFNPQRNIHIVVHDYRKHQKKFRVGNAEPHQPLNAVRSNITHVVVNFDVNRVLVTAIFVHGIHAAPPVVRQLSLDDLDKALVSTAEGNDVISRNIIGRIEIENMLVNNMPVLQKIRKQNLQKGNSASRRNGDYFVSVDHSWPSKKIPVGPDPTGTIINPDKLGLSVPRLALVLYYLESDLSNFLIGIRRASGCCSSGSFHDSLKIPLLIVASGSPCTLFGR